MKTFREFMIEARDETEIGAHTGKLVPKKQMSAAKRHEFEKKRRENLKKRPGDPSGDSILIKALRDKAKREGNYATESWSKKYKKSIDCNNPKGFSQKAHCAGKKKKK
tara:strand:+ start:72 stop:395 length:324 start_codon:yes stop_codon:yes gene_type:complete